MTTSSEQSIGKVIRVEWDQDTGEVRIVIDVTDHVFKSRVLHSRDLQDVITIKGKDVMVVATRDNNE